jgi:hypothetical protein
MEAVAGSPTLRWQAWLLVPQPPLSLLYLVAIRAERVSPSFTPVVALGTLPVVSALLGGLALRGAPYGRRRWHLAWVGVAVLEIAWTVLAAAMVGVAVAWRSG